MTKPTEGPLQALKQQLTERFNVAIEQDDPLLMTLTATLTIVEEASKLAHKNQMENLQRYSSELEMIHTRWTRHMEVTSLAVLDRVQSQALAGVEEAIENAAERLDARGQELLGEHKDLMVAHAWVISLSSLALVLSSAYLMYRLL